MIFVALADSMIFGMWMAPTEAPVGRLLQNVGNYIKAHPQDAQGYYILGRLHSLLFAVETKTIGVYQKTLDGLPSLPPDQSIIVKRQGGNNLAKIARDHLLESIRGYRRATELAPDQPMAFLGLGWMLESGADFAQYLGAPPGDRQAGKDASAWKTSALNAYRKAYGLSISADIKRDSLGPGADSAISLEAGEGIVRILSARKPIPQEGKEITTVRDSIAKLKQMPHAVTPIIFPLDRNAALDDLLDHKRIVRFDLDGDGQAEWWPWVKPETGILVWDPKRTGHVESGLQLFGSVTWWMAWQHGYQPLAALDDDQDGWLCGKELDGLVVWQDRNNNGLSERGEVLPVQSHRIRAIAATAQVNRNGVFFNPKGIRLNDGTTLPTYDWTPVEVKTLASNL